MKNKLKIGLITAVCSLSVLCATLVAGVAVLQKSNAEARLQLNNICEENVLTLCDSVSNIEVNLSKMLASGSRAHTARLADDTYRQTQSAVTALYALPLDFGEALETGGFLNMLGDWCNSYARAAENGDCDSYKAQTEQLYIRAARLNEAVRELAAGGGFEFDSQLDFYHSTNEKHSVEYPELIYDGPFSEGKSAKRFKALENLPEISFENAVQICLRVFADEGLREVVSAGESEEPAAYELYGKTDEGEMHVCVSKNGAKIISATLSYSDKEKRLDEETAKRKATEFAARLGYGDLKPVWYAETGGCAVVNLAPEIDGVVMYCDLVKVKVCLGDGDFLGLEATGYCAAHCEREVLPEITREEAQSRIAENLQPKDGRLAVIPKDGEEVLCYEFVAEYKGLDYFIYINASSGEEEDVLRVIDDEQGKMLM